MNGYDRITTVLALKEPDRIPMMEWSVHRNVIEGLCTGSDEFEFVEQLDLDGIAVRGAHHPMHKDASEEVFVDRWGVRWGRTAEAYSPVEGAIKSEAEFRAYAPPDPADESLIADVHKAVRRFKGKKFIVYCTRAEFMSAADLRGMAPFLMDMVDNPGFAHGVLDMISDFYCAVMLRAIDAGADAIMLGDDWAHTTGPFMSPAQFREFILPRFARAVRTCKDAGVYVFKHCDGNIWPILDMAVDTGIDLINPLQPDAGMDLGEVKQKYGHRLCVSGNINCGYTLSTAPVEQVVREVKEAIEKAGPGGGYMMMSSNTLHSTVKPENYKAMMETTREYGTYPLKLG